ncbi:MAG: hypothetical protein E7072_10530 [Bacteroidales bacterium]|nr:hypothetical protein [Bacteroidales bacterium]
MFGCSKKLEQSNDNGWNDLTKEQQEFWNSFDSNIIFQKEHVKFPLTIETPTYEEVDENNYKSYWIYDDSEPTVLSYEYKDNENFNIIKRGADNGIRVIYTFEKENDEWHLVYVLDESN